MKETIDRNYLEIKSVNALIESISPRFECSVNLVKPDDFKINKFFYKNIGKKHRWTDRLVWSESDWIKYSSDQKIETFILKVKNDLAGYFELLFHHNKNEVEIAYLGLLEDYHNKKLGSYLLSIAIKESFLQKPKRVWVHTCSLDHKNALANYISRGMKIFKSESILI